MRLDTSQQLRLQQQMKLSPRMIQAMEILQLPMLALQERLEQELVANPVLELRGHDPLAEAGQESAEPADIGTTAQRGERDLVVDDPRGNHEDFQRLADFEQEYGADFVPDSAPARSAVDPDGRDRKLDALANTPAPDENLTEHLQQQWLFEEVPPAVKQAGETLIPYIDDDGYLRTDLDEIARSQEPPIAPAELQAALARIQTLEPLGVGARDLRECLLIQLAELARQGSDVKLETELVRHWLRDIEANRLPLVARRLGQSIEQVKAALANLAKLNPRPGSLIGRSGAPAIHPDVIIEVDDDGQIVAYTPGAASPRLGISRQYRRLAKDKSTDRQAKHFLQTNIRSAQWLIGAVEQRKETVRRVALEVFTVQREFLEAGPEALRPLPMADVAQRVGVHVATVSRAVAGKYVQTPRGIFPLRMFFSGGTTTAEGQDVSWDAVKAKLQEVVDAEDKSNPLNDDQLAEALKAQGIDIARRTIAKYRGILDIPPARQRRQY